jgi:hypothetical protein
MTAIFEWVKKLLSGFNFGSSAVIGKWIFYLAVFCVFMFGWSTMTGKRTTTKTNQKAQEIINHSYAPQQTFGCMRLDITGLK